MTDHEFALLQKEIQDTAAYLERLQQRHIKETGQRYMPNRLAEPSHYVEQKEVADV